MLRHLDLLPVYNRDNCPNLVEGLYVPALSRSVRYDRTTYTFSPQSLIVAAAGLAGLINNGGQMRLICHHQLPRDVVKAVVEGHRAAEDAVLESLGGHGLTEVGPYDLEKLHHLKLLTWLVKEKRLEIKVAIPRSEAGIFHRKVALFIDGFGDRVAFDGSLNESTLGWLYNDEQVSVFTSWSHSAHLDSLADSFETLWDNRAGSSIVIPIPEALRQNLIEFAPEENPASSEQVAIYERGLKYRIPGNRRDKLWQAISDAVANDPQTSLETVAAELWPHQLSFWRRYARDTDKPPRVLIADEVGLGKTIQAGAVLKTLINRGQADQVLILTPAVARWQWQAELRHKFNIEVPVLDRRGAQLQLVSSDGTSTPSGSTPWCESRRLILSYDWLRRNAERFFRDETQYDMVVFDEAHHARYLDVATPQNRRPNSYLTMLRRLSERTGGLMLLTATPMQIDPSELWALLQVLDAGGEWNEAEFRRLYDTNAPTTLEEWNADRQVYARQGLPGTVEQISELARMPVHRVREHLDYIQMPPSSAVVLRRDMTLERIRESMTLMRRSSSVKRSVSRHTRNLLRQYAQDGRLKRSVPQREVRNAVVDMTSEERGLYDDIDEFVRQCYQGRSNLNRQGLGFVMTHFRLRLGSSRYAFLRSLEDLQQRAAHRQAEELPWIETPEANGDEYSDFDPDTSPPLPEQSSESQRTLSSMLERCRSQTGPDSKFTSLLTQLERLRAEGFGKVMVFSQFRDTQIWLREQLASNGGDRLIAGLSGAEDWIYQRAEDIFSPHARDVVVREFREQPEGILLCTETAAESLNFQFCSALINYDIPWNPMRLEQRIGRIDRIGQQSPVIRIVHLFYRDTVEYDAYSAMEERIREFQDNVGTLQPILEANLESLIRESVVNGKGSQDARERIGNLAPNIGFDLDDLAAAAVDQQDPEPRFCRRDLSHILDNPQWLPDGYRAERAGDNHWRVTLPSGQSYVVTADRAAHDYSVGSIEFFGPGSLAFPELPQPRMSEGRESPRNVRDILADSVVGP